MKTQRRSKKLNKTKRVFKKKDWKSGDGMLTNVWGPPFWHVLHSISFNYPINPTKEDKIHYRDFVLGLKYVLPCRICRENFVKNIKSLPLTMEVMKNRDTFSRYIYNLHELINKMIGKKSGLTYCDVRELYEHFRARCSQPGLLKKKENGCTEPIYGLKSKCVLRVIPQDNTTPSFKVDQRCKKKKLKI
jgi:hypothetical protein